MKRVWSNLDAALMHALLGLSFEQRRELERKLDRAIVRARSREEQRRASLLGIRAALGFVPSLAIRQPGFAGRGRDPVGPGVEMPPYFAKLRRENVDRSQYWARVAETARLAAEQMNGSNTRQEDRRVSHL